jgi:hypothetical protein
MKYKAQPKLMTSIGSSRYERYPEVGVMREKSKIPTVAMLMPVTIKGRGPIFGSKVEATPAPMTIPTVNGKKATPALIGE